MATREKTILTRIVRNIVVIIFYFLKIPESLLIDSRQLLQKHTLCKVIARVNINEKQIPETYRKKSELLNEAVCNQLP